MEDQHGEQDKVHHRDLAFLRHATTLIAYDPVREQALELRKSCQPSPSDPVATRQAILAVVVAEYPAAAHLLR